MTDTPGKADYMTFTGRLYRIPDDEVWSQEALDAMVGQTPELNGVEGAERGRVVKAWCEDGWLMATIEPLP